MANRLSECRAIWAALELGRPWSLDDLELIARVKPAQSIEYLDMLMQHKYVRAVGVRRAGSGEAVPIFQLVRRTGPDAPYLDIWKELVDPNERRGAEMARKTKATPRRASLAARVRVAAERLSSFTRAELMAAVFGPEPSHIERSWFNSGWNEMILKGHIASKENGHFSFSGDIDPMVSSIRRILKGCAGKMISRQSMEEQLGFSPTGPQMRHALDLLKAAGLQVKRRGYGGKTIFSVEMINPTHDHLPSD